MHWQGYSYNRGIYYGAIGWILTIIAVTVVTIRIYSRAFLTRSIGSDDFAIIIPALLTLEGEINDTINVGHGLGRHSSLLDSDQLSQITKWEYVDWIVVFISYFFVRTSVMLFVLRLLPPTKKLQQNVIFVTFFLNFAITMIATVSYSIKCVPFQAIYKTVPNAKCLSENVLTTTQYVNAVLACLIDIATALIPQFLLWNVQMKRKTKLILDIIFALGLITAGLSIGRAATTNTGIWKMDSTWRVMPSDTFSMVEEKCGIIFASCPALRQFWAYRKRAGTVFPSNKRQAPDADFVKMRRKINLRDIFWYRKPIVTDGRVIDAHPTFQHPYNDVEHMPEGAQTTAEKSPIDIWGQKIKRKMSGSSSRQRLLSQNSNSSHDGGFWHRLRFRKSSNGTGYLKSEESARQARLEGSANRGQGWPGLGSEHAERSIARRYDRMNLPVEQAGGRANDCTTATPYTAFPESAYTSGPAIRPQEDVEFADELSNPIGTRAPDAHAFPAREVSNEAHWNGPGHNMQDEAPRLTDSVVPRTWAK